jgi:hopanoid biosynthesis associated protein HpnK
LVVNADDFGLSEGINRGIQPAFLQGILRSTSLMPNGPAFADAARIVGSTPGLDVGIHLSLVGERCVAPLGQVRGLAGPDGSLPASYASFIKAYALRRFGLRQIRAEIEAQVGRVLDAGIKPTHLDSHQHLHILPGILDIVLDVAKASGIRVVRLPLERGGVGRRLFSLRSLQLGVLSLLCRNAVKKMRRAGMRCADHFWGLGVSGHMSEANLVQILNRLHPGVNEIMCHPGFSDPATEKRYPWGYRWDDEAAALRSDAIRRTVEERHIRLAGFGDAWDAGDRPGP